MTGQELRQARTTLGYAFGLGRPLRAAEMGRLLRVGSRDAGTTIARWEDAVNHPIPGPASVAIDMMLAGARPPTLADCVKLPAGPAEDGLLESFEYSVLRAIETLGALGVDANGAQICDYLTDKLRRPVATPQVYVMLSRLEKLDFVSSEIADSLRRRGGRKPRRFHLKTAGTLAMTKTAAALSILASSRGVRL